MNYYTRELLSAQKIEDIKYLIKIAEDNDFWVDGNVSIAGVGINPRKKNTEITDDSIRSQIFECIMDSLDIDDSFIDFVVPHFTGTNIISRYNVGDFYDVHLDGWENGDYSTTVFLSDPETYDGGELCLNLNANGTFEEFKLPFGWAVTYPTGISHKVNRVTRGVRYSSVFWTTSLVKDPVIREVIGDVGRSLTLLGKPDNMSKEHSEMLLIMSGIRNKLIRSEYYYNNR